MARTRAADYDRKRTRIAGRAARLFARNSFAGTSIAELALDCRITKSVIYHYYKSKDDILFAVMEEFLVELVKSTDRKIYAQIEKKHQFTEFSVQVSKRYDGFTDHQKVVLYELKSLKKKDRENIVCKQRFLIDFAQAKLKTSNISHVHNDDRIRVQVMLFFGMLNWIHTWHDPTRSFSRDELARLAAATAIKALA